MCFVFRSGHSYGKTLASQQCKFCLLVGDNERWRCYVCDPKPLLGLIEHCTAVMEALARQEKLESDKRRKPDGSSKPITGTQYQSSIVKTATGSKQVAQPVSVIQTASVATIAKSRMPSSVDAAKQQAAKVAGKTIASLLCEPRQQQQPNKLSTKTVASLLAEQGLKPGMTVASSSQSQVASTVARAARPMQQHVQNVVTSQNVLIVLDRLLSATNSMNVFLQSLRMDARKNAVGNTQAHLEKRREIAGKLTRAYAAYTRSFQEVATHSTSSSNAAAASQLAKVNAAKAQQGTVVRSAPPASVPSRPPINNQRSVLNHPPVKSVVNHPPVKSNSSEVIEISDSEDDRASAVSVVKSKNLQPLTTQRNVVVPVASGKTTERQLITAVPVKVVNQNATNVKKRPHSPDDAAGHPVSNIESKRACVNSSSEPDQKPRASSGEDGVMFDGGVEEIPHDDVNESSDNHHLQMYCVEVNEDSDDSDTPPSNVKLENGRLPTVSAATAVGGRSVKPRSLLEAELTRNVSTSRSVVS